MPVVKCWNSVQILKSIFIIFFLITLYKQCMSDGRKYLETLRDNVDGKSFKGMKLKKKAHINILMSVSAKLSLDMLEPIF